MSEYRMLKQALNGKSIDSKVLEAKAVLEERMSNLKTGNSIFAAIEFSKDVMAFESKSVALV